MIDLRSAIDFIEKAGTENGPSLVPSSVPLSQACGRILASDLIAPLDHPPFDQSLRDGVAIRFHAEGESPPSDTNRQLASVCETATDTYQLMGKILAGQNPSFSLLPGQAAIVMTGAPVPSGTDAVVMVEQVTWLQSLSEEPPGTQETKKSLWDGSEEAEGVRVGSSLGDCCSELAKTDQLDDRYLLKAGSLFHNGDSLLNAGSILTPRGIGLAASANIPELGCLPKPTVAILVTGDEVLPLGNDPVPGSIYNSNGPQLQNLAQSIGCDVIACDQVGDSDEEIRSWLKRYLGSVDMILTTGGVSVGTMDLMPSAFSDCDVKNVFHGVRMKPGKPIWFGRWSDEGSTEENTTFVFGLPGNPVGAFVGFHLFAKKLLSVRFHLGGLGSIDCNGDSRISYGEQWHNILLSEDWNIGKGGRPVFWPGIVKWEQNPKDVFDVKEFASIKQDRLVARPVDWKGSPDLRSVAHSNCLIFMDPNVDGFPEDGVVPAGTAARCLFL